MFIRSDDYFPTKKGTNESSKVQNFKFKSLLPTWMLGGFDLNLVILSFFFFFF